MLLLLLLLSHFSRVQLCATPQTAAHQAPPCLGLSRQGHWVAISPIPGALQAKTLGCHFLLQCMKVKSESEVAQLCLTLSDPMDCSPPGSSVHGIFQARVLEWGTILMLNSDKRKGLTKKSASINNATVFSCHIIQFFVEYLH